MPRHRPASLRRILPPLALALLLGLMAVLLFVTFGRPSPTAPSAGKPKGATQVSLRRDAPVAGKPAANAPERATTTPEPRKQRARIERPVAPESKV
jgi:hypothetical protein